MFGCREVKRKGNIKDDAWWFLFSGFVSLLILLESMGSLGVHLLIGRSYQVWKADEKTTEHSSGNHRVGDF